MKIKLNTDYVKEFLKEPISSYEMAVLAIDRDFKSETSTFKDYIGWYSIDDIMTQEKLTEINNVSKKLQEKADILVVIGIGGSYLGAKAALDFLRMKKQGTKEVIFAGYNLSSDNLDFLLNSLKDKSYAINVISKSGGTLETLITYNILKANLELRFPNDYKERIIITSNLEKGLLFEEAQKEKLTLLDVPNDIGGRYSVLTSVGLLPIAFAGYNINEMIKGAKDARKHYSVEDITKNATYQYAAIQNSLYDSGKKIELFTTFDEDLISFGNWVQQLFGESCGKNGKGIFPVTTHFSRDLHSIGQLIQEGEKIFFETFFMEEVELKEVSKPFFAPYSEFSRYDKQKLNYVNDVIIKSAALAHKEGDVPVLEIKFPKKDENHFGYLVYFFEKACAISARLLGVHPFNQPGVEDYKLNIKKAFES